MMLNLYNQLFLMSIIGTGLYLILKLSSGITLKYFKASWHYYSYISVYLFLLIPYYKLAALLNLSQNIRIELLPYLPADASSILSENIEYLTLIGKAEDSSSLRLDLLPYFLIMGTLVFIGVILIQNFKTHHHILNLCQLSDEYRDTLLKCKQEMGISKDVSVYVSSLVCTPFLYSIIKSRIILPDIKLETEELEHVFRHELTHLRRHDPWIKCLMLLINAIHWFNPLAYIARRDIERFCELSCDESVVRSMNNEERNRYCQLILSVLWQIANHRSTLSSAFSDKHKQLERRIDLIMNFEALKNKKWVRIFAISMTSILISAGTISAYVNSSITGYSTVTNEPIVVEPRDIYGTLSTALHSDEKNAIRTSTSVEKPDIKSNSFFHIVHRIEWDISAYEDTYATNQSDMNKGAKVQYNIEWTPKPGIIRIGLYNHDSGNFYWAASSTDSPLKGTITVPEIGLYSFAVGNRTDTKINATGSFTH